MAAKKNEIEVGQLKELGVESLRESANEMFEQINKMLELSILLLNEENNDIAVSIIEEDSYLDRLQNDLIVEVNYFIIREQPKAGDLRLALGTYAMSSDIERIGDYFKGFAKTMLKTGVNSRTHKELISSLFSLLEIRFTDTQEAFLTSNHGLAKSIAKRDSEIDDMTKMLVVDINERLSKTTEVDEVRALTRILLFAKTIERAGDHLVNICEHVSFIAKGQIYHYE